MTVLRYRFFRTRAIRQGRATGKAQDGTVRFSISQALATVCLLLLVFTLVNGYVLNLIGGYQADPWIVLVGMIVEALLVLAAARGRTTLDFDPLECAGWLVVVIGCGSISLPPRCRRCCRRPVRRCRQALHASALFVSERDTGQLVSGGRCLCRRDVLPLAGSAAAASAASHGGGVYRVVRRRGLWDDVRDPAAAPDF